MKLKVCLTGALLCVFAFTAVAQHDHSAPAAGKPQMDPAMMDAMMKAGIPGDPHKKLDGMAGTWDTKITMWMMPGMDPMTSTGMSTNQWVMGGRYLEQRFKGDFMGMPASGKRYEIGEIHIFRIRDGRVSEHWHQADFMGMMKQLGSSPGG